MAVNVFNFYIGNIIFIYFVLLYCSYGELFIYFVLLYCSHDEMYNCNLYIVDIFRKNTSHLTLMGTCDLSHASMTCIKRVPRRARLSEDGLKSKSIFKLNISGREKANFV
jgi:hypothetical protein